MGLFDFLSSKPNVKVLPAMPWSIIQAQLDGLGIPRYDAWDDNYYTVSKVDWLKIIPYCRKDFPGYVKDRFDCDKFAFTFLAHVFVAYVYENFEINSLCQAIGNTTFGYHSWNMIYMPDGFYYLEPQSGLLWKAAPEQPNDKYKRPDYALFG